MRSRALFLLAAGLAASLALLPCLDAAAQDAKGAGVSAAAPPAAEGGAVDEAAKLEARRRDTIRYGIDAEIAELVKGLGDEKDGRYDEDLLRLLEGSRSNKLRGSIMDFFAALEWGGAEKAAIGLVADRDNQDSDLVGSALGYLAAIKSKEALALSKGIIDGNDKKLLPALVRLMGRAGGEAEEELLLSWFDGDSATPALKEEAIKALGDIGSAKAADRLGKLILDPAGGMAARMFACGALAKIKDPASVDPLAKTANDADPNVRTAAIEALGAFAESPGSQGEEARGAITEGLRDSFVKARIAACKAAVTGRVVQALPFLRYKAQSDPERAVKTEALRSLAQLGSAASGGDGPFAFLRERLADPKEDPGLRSLCFGLLARYDADGSLPALKARLAAESQEKEKSFYTALAREVANADQAPAIGSLAEILLSDKDYLIRIAAVEWIRKNKAGGFKSVLERLAAEDPADLIKRRAADALKALR
jgi:hypothetical protein